MEVWGSDPQAWLQGSALVASGGLFVKQVIMKQSLSPSLYLTSSGFNIVQVVGVMKLQDDRNKAEVFGKDLQMAEKNKLGVTSFSYTTNKFTERLKGCPGLALPLHPVWKIQTRLLC